MTTYPEAPIQMNTLAFADKFRTDILDLITNNAPDMGGGNIALPVADIVNVLFDLSGLLLAGMPGFQGPTDLRQSCEQIGRHMEAKIRERQGVGGPTVYDARLQTAKPMGEA